MWTRTGTVLSVSSRATVTACDRLGLDTDALLAAAGVSREVLDDPDGRLEAAKVSALWAKAYELSGDPVLSLHAAEACPIGAYKVIDYMGYNSATVGEAFRYPARYFWLINTAIRLPIDESGDPVTFDVEDDHGPSGVSRFYAEYCLAAFVIHVRGTTGVDFPVERVTFVHRRPADIREHERIFGCPVEFETGHNRLYVSRAAWESRTTRAQPGALHVLSQHADMLLEKLPRGPDLVERLRKAIGSRLRGGDSSLESVAHELGLSARGACSDISGSWASPTRRSPTRFARPPRGSTSSSPTSPSPRWPTCSASRTRAPSTAHSSAGPGTRRRGRVATVAARRDGRRRRTPRSRRSARPAHGPEALAHGRCDLRPDQLDRAHQLLVRQRRGVHLERDPREAAEHVAVVHDLLRHLVRIADHERARGAQLRLEVAARHRAPAALLPDVAHGLREPGEVLVRRLL